MRSQFLTITLCTTVALGSAVAAPPSSKEALQALVARMDKAAGEFKTMTARITYVTHTDVLNEDNTETGTAVMKKVQAGEVQALIDFVSPDKHAIYFEKRHVERYFPKIKTLEVWDLDQHGEQLDKFLMIGFGTSGSELAKDYDMSVLGTETAKGGASVVRLQLVPKAGEAREYLKHVELWFPEQGDPYPLRERILQPSGDYAVIIYTDIQINPVLKPDALQLKLPSGVKTVHPGQ